MLTACGTSDEQSPLVARVYDYELRMDDLVGLVGEGVSAEDSAAIVDNYVDQWVRQKVILAKAEKNVKDDFSRQMNEYRNSLLTFAYEEQIVAQIMDTVVTDSQIEEYYEANTEQFLLNTQDNLHIYLRGLLKEEIESAKAIVFNGTKVIGSFKGKVCFSGAKVEDFDGSDRAMRIMKETAQSVGVSLETERQREDDDWDVSEFYVKVNPGA